LENLRRNLNHQVGDVRLFEIGKVFHPREIEELPVEKQHLAAVASGGRNPDAPLLYGAADKFDIYDMKGVVETLLANLDQLKGKRRENLENYADLARLSKKLVTLVDNLDLEVDDHAFTLAEPDREALTELFKECEFYKLLQEFSIDTKNRAESAGYLVVLTESDLDELVAALEQSERFAFDTETTSLDAMRADLVGLSFAVTAGEAWYVPVGHHYLGMPEQLPLDRVLEAVRPLLASPRQLKIGQNLKYDILVLARAGIEVSGPIYDTMLASYLANPATRSHGMDNLAAELLNYHTISYSEVAGSGKKQIGFEEVEVEKATTYAAEDADITLRLYEKLVPMVTEQHQDGLLNDVEMPLLQILAGMERAGIRINPEFLGGLSADMEKKLAVLETEIHQLAGGPFNIGSPKQLGEVLFENLGLPKGKKTKTGWSTDVEVLNKLAEDHEIAAKILDYRSLMKLKGTYTDALPKLIHPETGRIHTSFNQAVTATGRLSSSDPNLQNIPIRTEEGRRIREGFIPSDGCVLLSADYSQVELRILAHMADEPALKEAFARGEDIHRSTASEVLGLFPEMVTDEQRRAAKAINFGVVYGISAFGLAKQLGINRREAQQFIDTYFERYPGIRTFMDACIAEAREKMYVTTLLGRRCAIPEINSKNGAVRGYAERNAINYPVQGSAADIIKVAMVKIAARLAKEGLQARMLLQVHDELVFDVPQAELEKVSALVKSEMQGAVDLSVPLLVEVGSGRNWREAH
jgi:DNA polymerase-1